MDHLLDCKSRQFRGRSANLCSTVSNSQATFPDFTGVLTVISVLASVPFLDAMFLCEFFCLVDVSGGNSVDLDFGVALCGCDQSGRCNPGSSQDAELQRSTGAQLTQA